MPCSGRDYDTPSRVCVPLNAPLAEIVQSASGELEFVPSYQGELADDAKDKEHLIQPCNTKTMATWTEFTSGSSSGHSSSIASLSSTTSSSSALYNEPGENTLATTDPSIHTPALRPTRATFTIGPREDVNGMPNEGSSISASRRMKVEGKGKTPEEVTISPRSPTARYWEAANNAIGEQKYPLLDNQTSICYEIEEPSSFFLESSSTAYDSENDDFAELSASVTTIRPPSLARTVIEPPESTASSVVDNISSTATSPHSDQGYTWEVRPPSIIATHDGEDHYTYGDSPTMPQINSPRTAGTISPASSSASRPNSRRQVTVRVASPPELPPVPPVASIRVRRPGQDGPQLSGSRPSSLSDRRGLEYPRANPASLWHLRSPPDEDEINGQVAQRSTSTARSPSLSPLAWETASAVQGPTSLTSSAPASVDYLTGPWPSETLDIPNTMLPSPSNPLLSTSNTRPVSTPNVRGDESRTYSQSGRMQSLYTGAEVMSSPDSPVSVPATGLSNPPSAPQRTRLAVPLPPSPGSSLRTSAFNSPFVPGASPVDSWGTPATMPGESVYNQTTSIPGQAGQWPDLLQPQLPTRNSTWLPEANPNGNNPLWTSVDWSAWSDPTQIPQVTPISTANLSPPYITPPGYLLICSFCGSPAPACVCRRFVRVAPVSTGATSAGLRTPIRPPPTPHPIFWFSDGTVTFEVEDVFFKVHRYFFERHSEHFRIMLARRSANVVPVRIPEAKKLDFERLLKVFYPSNLANPDLATVEEWTSVLTLAVKLHMDELISLAIHELTPLTSAVDKISLAKRFGLFGYNLVPNSNYNRDWLLPALRELCGRNFPLRFEEARKMDMWTVVKIWEVQHEITNAGLNHNVSQIERLIKRRFGLE